MEKQEIGRFYAVSFYGKVIEFIVYDDNTMSCPMLDIGSFNKIELKPRFVLRGEDLEYTYDVPATYDYSISELIGEYSIDDELFEYLKVNRMIRYSTDMAYLYGFSDTNGYDSNNRYSVGSPYKWAKKKGPILVKQRKGQFN